MAAQRTPLYAAALTQGARMTDFSGWEMPVQYSGIKQEHGAVRQHCGMFDISHMGKFWLQGANLMARLQGLVPTDLSDLEPGRAQYTVLLNATGGILDDLIFYRQEDRHGEQRVAAIVNAATTDKDRQWLQQALGDQATLMDLSRQRALLAVQGPEAVPRLQTLTEADLGAVRRYHHLEATVNGAPAFLARTGYTGEDGFEVMVAVEDAEALWQALLDLDVVPCGLGARDTLRLEAAMALYGQDITESTTPLQAGLGWLVHLDCKGDFVGRVALEAQQSRLPNQLVGLRMQGRHIARHDYPVLHGEEVVGTVTSGTLSPTLGYPIALAYVPPELARLGQELAVSVRGRPCAAEVVKRPFYRRAKPTAATKLA